MPTHFELIPLFVGICPRFRQTLVADADYWLGDDGNISACAILSSLARFVVERVREIDCEGISELFDAAERLMSADAQEIQDAVATCFLESLINTASHTDSPNPLDPELFVSLLGPLSRKHCQDWDTFTGARTKGLW